MDNGEYLKLLSIGKFKSPSAKIKIGLLSDFSIHQLSIVLKGIFLSKNINIQVLNNENGDIEAELIDSSSVFNQYKFDLVVILFAPQKAQEKHQRRQRKINFPQEQKFILDYYKNIVSSVMQGGSQVLVSNLPLLPDVAWGNRSILENNSLAKLIDEINKTVYELIKENKGIYLLDIASLVNFHGIKNVMKEDLWFAYQYAFKPTFFTYISEHILSLYQTLNGKIIKAVIVDLDNTLWGGIVGEDGVEGVEISESIAGQAYQSFQYLLLQLKNRGIILNVCSKNDVDLAKKPFQERPDMILKLSDFALFLANWNNKSENIKKIAEILNISLDAILFIDDSAFERNQVKTEIPELIIPEYDGDPFSLLENLKKNRYFETVIPQYVEIDRTALFQQENFRQEILEKSPSYDDYLNELAMVGDLKIANQNEFLRIESLLQRSNQFNLTTRRTSAIDIKKIVANKGIILRVSLSDKLGEYGLIAVIILLPNEEKKTMIIHEFVMSCRVLKRTVEDFIFNNLVDLCIKNGIQKIIGQYVPTQKNKLVENLYEKYQFDCVSIDEINNEKKYLLNVEKYLHLKTFVKKRYQNE